MKRITLLILTLIIAFLVACEPYTPTPLAGTPGVIGSPRPTLPGTPEPSDPAYQIYLDAVQAEKTLVAIQAQMTATERVVISTGTAQAKQEQASATAYAQSMQATATERAWISARETAAAQGTATAQAYQATLQAGVAMSTATAQYQATQGAVAVQQTQQVLAYNATVDAASAQALATAQADQAESANLALEREKLINRWAAVVPYLVGSALVAIALYLIYKFVRTELERRRVIRDGDGNPKWYIPDDKKPTIILPERFIGPGASVEDGEIQQPPQLPGQIQITSQAQLVEMLRSLPPEATRGSGISRRELIQMMLNNLQNRPQIPTGEIIDIQVVDADDPEVRQWVADVEAEFVKDQILY